MKTNLFGRMGMFALVALAAVAAASIPAFAAAAATAINGAEAVVVGMHLAMAGAQGLQLQDVDNWQLAALGFGGLTVNSANLAILQQSFNAAFKKGLGRAKPQWQDIAMRIPSTTAENVYAWLAANFQIREWVGDRNMQNLADYNYVVRNKDFEGTVEVLRNNIADDQYGIYAPLFEQMGDSVNLFPDKLVFQALKAGDATACYDGQYFFDTDHPVGLPGKEASVANHLGGASEGWWIMDTTKVMKPVIFQDREAFKMVRKDREEDENVFNRKKFIYGVDGRCNVGYGLWQLAFMSKQALTTANIRAALTAMASQKDNNGEPLNVQANVLACSPNLYETAMDLMSKDVLSGGESNTLKGRLKVIGSGWLL